MSSKTKKYIFSFIFIFQNFLYFLIFLINYNSTKGTDYEKYSTLLNYFTTNQTGLAGLESGLSYFWFVSLIAPKILALLLPLISFATIVYTYQKLKADSELIVMESFGISKFTLMIPALIFGVIASVILLFIEAYLSPSNYKTFKDKMD